jgi:SAM-dependent methyltransferase
VAAAVIYAPLLDAGRRLSDTFLRLVRRRAVTGVQGKTPDGAVADSKARKAADKGRKAAEKHDLRKAKRAAAKGAEKERREAENERPGAEQPASYFDAVYRSSDLYKREITPWSGLWERVVEAVGDARSVVDLGCGPGHVAKLLQPLPLERYVGLDFSHVAVTQARERQPDPRFDFRTADLRTASIPDADLYIACEFVEHIESDLTLLQRVPAGARVVITLPSFPDRSHVRHFATLESALARYGGLFELSGEVVDRWFLLSGTRREASVRGRRPKIVRMMALWNEVDILEQNLAWYADRGFPTVVVDNGSTDGSYALCRAADRDGTVIALERIETEHFEWGRLLSTLLRLAAEQGADYVLLASPDEFFEAADGSDLRSAMEEDFAAGYTVLEFANMEFQMTHHDPADSDPLTRMTYYTYRRESMPRAFPLLPGLDATLHLGHALVFPSGIAARRSPRQYISRHYPLRSEEQAQRKIARVLDRRPRELRQVPVRYLRILDDPANLYMRRKYTFHYEGDHHWEYVDKAMPARLAQTENALKKLYLRFDDLSREHAASLARSETGWGKVESGSQSDPEDRVEAATPQAS